MKKNYEKSIDDLYGFTDICDSEKGLHGGVCEGYCDGSGQEKEVENYWKNMCQEQEAPKQQGRDLSPGK